MGITITIVIPCFNQAKYLPEAIESVMKQSFENWQCIIVNDGSTDNTEEVALSWSKQDNRIQYLKQENRGVSAARNTGISSAVGEFILPLDADDKIHKHYIQNALDAFSAHPDINGILSYFVN